MDLDLIEFRKKLDKYFTPSKPAIENYIFRGDVDDKFIDALYEPGLQIIVYGSTGVGKSSLVWSTLEREKLNYIRISFDKTINEQNFCPKIMEELGFEKTTQNVKETTSGTSVGMEAGSTIWNLITFKGKFDADSSTKKGNVYVPYYNDADIDAVVKALTATNFILFLDDVEKADNELRTTIAHLGKKLSDNSVVNKTNAKVIYGGVSQEVNKLISVDKSLRDRLAEQLMTNVKTPEIKKIIENGWREMGFTWNDSELNEAANICCGYARYAHWIGKQSALSAFRNNRNVITQSDIDKSLDFIIEKYRDEFQTRFDSATGHKSGLRLRENILYALATSPEIEVKIDYIVNICSQLVHTQINQNQVSGPIGELKKPKRGCIVEDGRMKGYHRFSDLMIKPYIRMIMKQNNINI